MRESPFSNIVDAGGIVAGQPDATDSLLAPLACGKSSPTRVRGATGGPKKRVLQRVQMGGTAHEVTQRGKAPQVGGERVIQLFSVLHHPLAEQAPLAARTANDVAALLAIQPPGGSSTALCLAWRNRTTAPVSNRSGGPLRVVQW